MHIKKVNIIIVFFLMLLAGFPLNADEEDTTLKLKIGDPNLKDKVMEIVPGKIYSCKQGKEISFEQMINEMNQSKFIYIGESHNSLPIHKIQLQIIRALYQQERQLAVGLEMFNIHLQETLNKWSIGVLTAEEFIEQVKWYINWNFNFKFYSDIFNEVKNHKIPLYALNAPRKIITKIRTEGWEALSSEEQSIIPKPEYENKEHRSLIRATFENMDLPPQMKGPGLEMMFEGLYRAQSAWDEVMAYNTQKTWERENKKVVVLVGSGHLLYNLGINRIVAEKNLLPFKTVICVDVPLDKKSLQVSRSLADFIWCIPEEKLPAYPSFGLALKKFTGLDNPVVERNPINGVTKDAGFLKGDIILDVDGIEFNEINNLRVYLSKFDWDDALKFRVLRAGEEKLIHLNIVFKEDE